MPAIELRDIHKTFRLPHEVHTTLTERILSGFRRTTYERFEALRGVDLTLEKGSFVGLVGGNGSGKSTLLKIVSGLLPPDRGEVHVDGSMSALLELGLGFSAELTVRENVELYAAVLGYPRREVARRVDEAIEFAGLHRFRDAKLKNLSTGMRARLGFATALQSESDIMLLDEILAVGDADFQMKCLDVFEDLKQRRKTIMLVSHDLNQVRRFCDEAVWLHEGVIAVRGDPDAVIAQYLQSVRETTTAEAPAPVSDDSRLGDGRVRMLRGWMEDEAGKRIGRVRSGDRAVLVAVAEVFEDCSGPVFGVALQAQDGARVYVTNSQWTRDASGELSAGMLVEVRIPFLAALRNGSYAVQGAIGDRQLTVYHDITEPAFFTFVVHGSACRDGAADLQARVSCRVLSSDEHRAARAAG
jgi:ABC-type polysaccharide/polyol phosphate transport system ATPase subunit